MAGQTLTNRETSTALQSLSVAPNPTEGAAVLSFSVGQATKATVYVTDALGRRVATVLQSGKLSAGPQLLELPATLAPGVYVATVATTESTQAVRFVVTR